MVGSCCFDSVVRVLVLAAAASHPASRRHTQRLVNEMVARFLDEICRLWRSASMFDLIRWLAESFAGAVMNLWSTRSLLGACALAILVARCSSDSTAPKSSDLAT